MYWVVEEFVYLEKEVYYYKDFNYDVLNSNIMCSLKKKDWVFLLWFFVWCNVMVEWWDYFKEMVLLVKYISYIVCGIVFGVNVFK